MAGLPPVKLETHTTWFNLLLTVLHEHAESNPYEEYRQMAQKLIAKCMAYGTPFTDGYGASCVDLRMYPSEAGDTIWLLLLALCGQYDPDRDYSAKAEKRRKRIKKEVPPMAIRYKALTELYRETQRNVTAPAQWQEFLASACRNYRLSFDEQLLVYAQRPDATAVLEIERWNKRFGRWVNRGANGIAVFDGESERPRLKYYFDISDTHEGRFPRPVPLWDVRPEYAPDIIETMENSFGELSEKEDLGAALISAAKNAVEDNMPDYLSELKTVTEGSFLEGLDELNLEVMYREALKSSIGYMLLARCGLDPSEYFEDEDFRDVLNFNTSGTLNALGVATGDISQMCLSEISRTVLALQRQPQKENRTFENQQKIQYPVSEQENTQPERSFENGRDHIHEAGRLQSAKPLPPQEEPVPHGKYALLRRKFLKEHRRITYTNLLTSGKLSSHLAEIQQTAQRRMEQMVAQMAKENDVTEELKERDQMKWVGMMNNLQNAAEEVVLAELIYN